jgi:hypothetical protein
MKIEQVIPFENEEGDLQKLNITIQFVFLSISSLYIASLPSTFKNILYFSFWCIQYYKNFSIW